MNDLVVGKPQPPNTACTRQRVRAGKFSSLRGVVVRQIGWFASHPLSGNARRWAVCRINPQSVRKRRKETHKISLFGLFGPPNVYKLKLKRNISGLIKALAFQKDKEVRQSAAEALGEIGDTRAVEPLISVLMDEESDVRHWAAEALGKIGDFRAVAPLIVALRDVGFRGVHEIVVEALIKIGAPAIESLTVALKDKNEWVCKGAANALQAIGWQPSGEKGAWYWIALHELDECVKIGAPAVEPLIAAFKDNDRWDAARALGKIGDARAVEPLIDVLAEYNLEGRSEQAALALKSLGWHPQSGELYFFWMVLFGEWYKVPATPDATKSLLALFLHEKDEKIQGATGKILYQILREHAEKLTSDALMKLTSLPDVTRVEWSSGESYSDRETTYYFPSTNKTITLVDHEQIRELAKQELTRRSNVN